MTIAEIRCAPLRRAAIIGYLPVCAILLCLIQSVLVMMKQAEWRDVRKDLIWLINTAKKVW